MTSKRVLFIEHDHVSEAGPIWEQFVNRGYEITRFHIVSEANFNQPNVSVVWPDLLTFDVVVVMGAPWGAWEDERIGNWLLPEVAIVREVHDAGVPILGICFGGQLMARVLGGSVGRAERAEVGWFDIETDRPDFIPTGPWFQYHWDRWVTPPDATEIARTDVGPQAFIYGRTLALQFHPEIDPYVLDLWLEMDGGCAEVEAEGLVVETLREQTRAQEPYSNKRAYDLVDQFLDQVAVAPIKRISL